MSIENLKELEINSELNQNETEIINNLKLKDFDEGWDSKWLKKALKELTKT